MNYIAEMRKHVGHDVVMTVGCGVLIENEKGEVLLQRRSDTGEWCVPGGALEPGEISDSDSEVLEHRFFDKDSIPKELFYPDARPILDWAKGEKEIAVK